MTPIRVLFLCTGNSARSLMAEALLRSLGAGAFEVHSAGTRPTGVNPFTELVLEEEDLPVAGLRSKDAGEFAGEQFDYVITVCDSAAEECPVFPGAPKRIHWSMKDPAAVDGSDAEKEAAFRTTLLGLRERIQGFIPVARGAAARA